MAGRRQAAATNEMMMFSGKWITAVTLAGALAVAGCGKPQADAPPSATEPATLDVADAQPPPTAPEPGAPVAATNDTLTAAGKFAAASEASPFAKGELALKESYNRALIAFQIGDYARAVSELDDLVGTPELTPVQHRAVRDLLAKTLKLAPELAASQAITATAKPAEFPVAVPGTAEAPKNVPESPFSTADPAIKRSFARAKAAYDLGNYESARAELQDLATNTQLNFQQKYAVQALLDKTPGK
jgi:hypothetical protein